MACALCASNAPRPVAFPRRLIGSFPLNRTLSVRLTFFFATTVSEPAQLARNFACAVARHENSVAVWLKPEHLKLAAKFKTKLPKHCWLR
jgi:hypothetical protein